MLSSALLHALLLHTAGAMQSVSSELPAATCRPRGLFGIIQNDSGPGDLGPCSAAKASSGLFVRWSCFCMEILSSSPCSIMMITCIVSTLGQLALW